MYSIKINAPRVSVTVSVDPRSWPQKTAGHMAREALSSLAKGVTEAIEAAAHVGITREHISVSPVEDLGEPLRVAALRFKIRFAVP